MPRGLTVLAPIRAGQAEALRDVLRAIGDDIRGTTAAAGTRRPHIDFARSRRIHFARLTILRDPDRGAQATRLLLSTNYDGTLDEHIAELSDITSDMEAIWGRCEGYRGLAGFPAFIRTRALEPLAFYIAHQEETAESIRRAGTLRRLVRDMMDSDPAALASLVREMDRKGVWLRHAGRRLRERAARIARAAPLVFDIVRVVSRYGVAGTYRAASRITASLNRYLLFRLANRITQNRMPARRSMYSSAGVDNCGLPQPLDERDERPAAFDTAPFYREDVVTQNQLTLVTVVDPHQVTRVKAVMATIESYAARLAPPGSLIGISTIHFVRWLLVDDDRRLIMLSDYDGSWENYIDEFAEMILSSLDAIWETSFGFPPDGARDLPAFKRFLRTHQVAAEVFFSAYPDQTILNIAYNTRLCRAVNTGREPLTRLLPTC